MRVRLPPRALGTVGSTLDSTGDTSLNQSMFAWIRSFLSPKEPNLSEAPDEPVPSERVSTTRPEGFKPWIGVDLDGTLARADSWEGITHIGDPIPLMLRRVRIWVEKGMTVKILTARACDPAGIAATQAWLVSHGLPALEVTDRKDFGMIELWDDRAIQVVHNSGVCFLSPSVFGRPRAPILPDEIADQTYILVGAERFQKPTAPPPSPTV